MTTRAATAREAALVASSMKPDKFKPSAPSNRAMTKISEVMASANTAKDVPAAPPINSKKRKATSSGIRNDRKLKAQVIKGGWGELPHNIGKLASGIEHIEHVDGDVQDPGVAAPLSSGRQKRQQIGLPIKEEEKLDGEVFTDLAGGGPPKIEKENSTKPRTKQNGRGKARTTPPITPESSDDMEDDPTTENFEKGFKEEIMQDIKSVPIGIGKGLHAEAEKPKRKRAPRAKKIDAVDDIQKGEGLFKTAEITVKKPRKVKANPYGLTPGVSPFPDFAMPTVEACKQVEDALSEIHGKVEPPKEIPAPSLEVTGCGEVPSVLDALVRTRLSASTTSQNAKYAFTGLVKRYGVRTEGIGAGSVDWNKVRESDVLEIENAIRKGGLAKTKSISIKKILEMVNDINIARRDAFLKERTVGDVSHTIGANNMTEGQKDMEISTVDQGVLSLDFMHGLTADEAMSELVKYPGIGVKTASCVILFCLQRPSFAVDTHVWRFCKWLRWVPEGATRDQTFSHCEVRIPNEMKYSLHQLFIRHGKTCGRCRAITGESSEGWEETICPLEHLVERTGKRKAAIGGMTPKVVVTKKGTKGRSKGTKNAGQWDGDSELSDITDSKDLESDDDSLMKSADEDDE